MIANIAKRVHAYIQVASISLHFYHLLLAAVFIAFLRNHLQAAKLFTFNSTLKICSTNFAKKYKRI
jgi:hypothetical protein